MNIIYQYYRNMLLLMVRSWKPCLIPKMKDHTSVSFIHCLYNIFTATLHLWRPLNPYALLYWSKWPIQVLVILSENIFPMCSFKNIL
jgi:hypothetical protein